MSEADKHLFLPSLYGYRLAISYFRLVKGGGKIYPRFPTVIRFGFLYENSSLIRLAGRWGRLQHRVPRGAMQSPGYVNELKLV